MFNSFWIWSHLTLQVWVLISVLVSFFLHSSLALKHMMADAVAIIGTMVSFVSFVFVYLVCSYPIQDLVFGYVPCISRCSKLSIGLFLARSIDRSLHVHIHKYQCSFQPFFSESVNGDIQNFSWDNWQARTMCKTKQYYSFVAGILDVMTSTYPIPYNYN